MNWFDVLRMSVPSFVKIGRVVMEEMSAQIFCCKTAYSIYYIEKDVLTAFAGKLWLPLAVCNMISKTTDSRRSTATIETTIEMRGIKSK